LSEFKLYEKLQDNLTYEAKEVYSAAAEVCGLTMEQMARSGVTDGPFETQLKAKITAMFNKGDFGIPVTILHWIGQHYSKFLDHFFLRIFELVRKLTGSLRAMVLELILWRATDIPDLFKRLQPLMGNTTGVSPSHSVPATRSLEM
jgi:DNA-dependent protein kinase catalytic subunit